MTDVGLVGATGAMGETVRNVAADRSDTRVTLGVTRRPDRLAGTLSTVTPDELDESAANGIDVIVDFSAPEATRAVLPVARAAGIPTVTGTTGFDDEGREPLREAATDVPVLHAPNFSRGVQTLRGLLETAVAQLPGYDIEVTETHHNRKRDAPSGTANRLVEVIEEARSDATRQHGRVGEAPRTAGEIGVHARRAGSITGEHEVLLAGADEELRLVHRAESRRVFAAGALDAATWIVDKPPGWYRFADVLEA